MKTLRVAISKREFERMVSGDRDANPWRDSEMRDDLIYDVGMHTGEDTEFYLRKGFRVVGIEANAQLCEECAHKFSAAIGSGQLQIINKAISHTVGTIDFFLNEQVSIWGTANLEWVKRNEARGFKSHPVKVEATTIRDVILKFGVPYYMKVDVEGMDSVCLEGLLSVEEKPKYISVEASATSIKDTFTQLHLLDQLGYTRFKIVPQLNITEQRSAPTRQERAFSSTIGSKAARAGCSARRSPANGDRLTVSNGITGGFIRITAW